MPIAHQHFQSLQEMSSSFSYLWMIKFLLFSLAAALITSVTLSAGDFSLASWTSCRIRSAVSLNTIKLARPSTEVKITLSFPNFSWRRLFICFVLKVGYFEPQDSSSSSIIDRRSLIVMVSFSLSSKYLTANSNACSRSFSLGLPTLVFLAFGVDLCFSGIAGWCKSLRHSLGDNDNL